MQRKPAMIPHSDSSKFLNRIWKTQGSRKPLTDVSDASSESPSDSDDKIPEQVSSPRNSVSEANFDSSNIEAMFRDLESENRVRSRQAKKGNGNFRSYFADASSSPTLYSILDDPDIKGSPFYGFYIFFWLGIGFFILKHVIHGFFAGDTPLHKAPVFVIFTTGLFTIAVTDLAMYLSIYFVFGVQKLCAMGLIDWRTTGRTVTSIYEVAFTAFWLYIFCERLMKHQWIGRVFLVLHMFVLLMKMHSYAFYNGYLWKILRELRFSESYLKRMRTQPKSVSANKDNDAVLEVLMGSIAFCKFELLHQSKLLDKARDPAIIEMDSDRLTALSKFPANINLSNFFQYTMFPTVSYSLTFARTNTIRKKFLFEKLCATVGVILLMLLIAQGGIYPLVMKCNEFRTRKNVPVSERAIFAVLSLVDLIPSFTLEYVFSFYLIWDVICNEIAELSMFADRDFYGPWWSCVDWSDFARLWNKPVHSFLLRHVYHSSISAFSLSKPMGGVVTFFISSVVHELVMYVIFGRIRGFLFFFQMSQIPLVLISRLPFMKNRPVLGNVICWFGFITGPPMITILYLVY